jgi:hypothetical protein
LAILDRIERQGYDVLTSRPRLGKLAKLGLLTRAVVSRAVPRAWTRSELNAPQIGRIHEQQSSRNS